MPRRPIRCARGALGAEPAPPAAGLGGWLPDAIRGNRHARGYDRHWVRLRAAKLAADPLCEDCLDEGLTTAAEEVHHVRAFRGRGDPLRLELSNLRSLCRHCHRHRMPAPAGGGLNL